MGILDIIGWLFTNGLVIPMTNVLILLSRLAFGNFGIGILIFTAITRAITWPLTQQQLRSTRAMSAVQPRIQEIQKKYKDPKRRSEETMKLYRESGVNPLGCVWPLLVQFPILIALFQAIRFTLGSSPERMLDLSQRLYSWSFLRTAVPLEDRFLWMELGQPDPTFIMAILVGASTWVQQKMTTPMSASADPQQQSMQRTMQWMMPLMFAFFTLQFPSGLALYWVATSVISIVLQYFYMGRKNFSWQSIFSMSPATAPAASTSPQTPQQTDEAAPEADEAADEEGQREEEPVRRRRRRRRRGRRRR
ncbi:MAG: membrane protein insertase YidC [Chloroflexi bacterium]|nr:membrane protein insertase YidC [Chloroflexota bacterium]